MEEIDTEASSRKFRTILKIKEKDMKKLVVPRPISLFKIIPLNIFLERVNMKFSWPIT